MRAAAAKPAMGPALQQGLPAAATRRRGGAGGHRLSEGEARVPARMQRGRRRRRGTMVTVPAHVCRPHCISVGPRPRTDPFVGVTPHCAVCRRISSGWMDALDCRTQSKGPTAEDLNPGAARSGAGAAAAAAAASSSRWASIAAAHVCVPVSCFLSEHFELIFFPGPRHLVRAFRISTS